MDRKGLEMSRIERMQLEIIRAIDRLGSVTAAAASLFVTQPALSHSIRKLEESFGLEIWTREGRSLQLTQGGEHLLSVANRLLPQFERAEQQLEQFAQGERGTLRIGMECHPCYQWLLKIAATFLRAWPTVDLDVIQKFQFGGIDALYGNDIDTLVTPDPLQKQGLHFEPVFDYEQVMVVGKDHPLRKAKHVEPEQLADETLVTYPVSVDRLDIYSRFLTPAGIIPKAA
jgi:LysR family transcriptional regulator for metE and metH